MKPFALIFGLIAIAITLAKAHPYIDEACKCLPTNEKQSCVSILTALPGSDTFDKKTLALSSMEFAESKYTETASLIKDKLQDKSLAPNVQEALKNCWRLYHDESYSFGFGILSFKTQNFDTANYHWMEDGYQYAPLLCENELTRAGVKGEQFCIKTNNMYQAAIAAKAVFESFSSKSN